MFPLLGQPSGQLRGRGRLARALQAQHEDHPRRFRARRQPTGRRAEQRQHLVAHDAHDLLPLASAVVQFSDQHYKRDAQGKIRFEPAQSLETWHVAVNPVPEIAGLKYVIGRLLELPADDRSAGTERSITLHRYGARRGAAD